MQLGIIKSAQTISKSFLEFVNKSPTPYHAVNQAKLLLLAKGFQEIKEEDQIQIQQTCRRYFFTRGGSSLIAFVLPLGYGSKKQAIGFRIVAAHSDSPCLRLAPHSQIKGDINQLNVVTYGGGLWSTWFDRDLGVSGRVIHKKQGKLSTTLWCSTGALCRIPHLAIHLRDKKEDTINKDTSIHPIFSCTTYRKLTGIKQPEQTQKSLIEKSHSWELVRLISEETQISPENIVDLDLYLHDVTPSTLIGLRQEFISSPRLDNLGSTFTALQAIANLQDQDDRLIKVTAIFDHQEIGSVSSKGAGSTMLTDFTNRIVGQQACKKMMQQSFILSADMCHGVHPNYPVHNSKHKVLIDNGIAIKFHQNLNYAGTIGSNSIILDLCNRLNIPAQIFAVRNQSPCGTTIGPTMTSLTGAEGVDVGIPQFAMHSCRQVCGVVDILHYYNLMKGFFQKLQQVKLNE